MTNPPPQGDTAAAIAFLAGYLPKGPWTLVHDLEGEGAPRRRWPVARFTPADQTQLAAWLDENQNVNNIYFVVNLPVDNPPLRTSPSEEEIAAYLAIPLDVDFPPDLQGDDLAAHLETFLVSLRSVIPPPTAITFSGGGVQGFWLFKNPLPLRYSADVERCVLSLATHFGGDHVQNVNRLMRLPGTVNVLNNKKRATGRVPAAAYLIEADWSRRYPTLDQFEAPATPPPSHSSLYTIEQIWRERIITGSTDWLRGSDRTRSAAAFGITCYLIRAGWSDDAIITVFTDPKNGVSKHILDQPSPQNYALKQVRDARIRVASDFVRNSKGAIIADSYTNVKKGFTTLDTVLSYDSFADRLLYVNGDARGQRPFGDPEEKFYRLNRFGEELAFRPTKEYFADAIVTLARERAFHPVVDYLAALKWDGTPRIDRWLVDLAKAPDTPYTRAVSRLILVAAVTRVREPGRKFDEMLVFESPQGMHKSTALHILAVNEDWFADSLSLGARDKEVIEQLAGKWLIEAADLSGMRKSDVETLKAFLSRQSDRARLAYGRFPVERPRACVFFGTTNSTRYLRDDQNRRFWPVKVVSFDLSALAAQRDQLWAEAAHAHAAGESIRLDPSLYDAAASEQSLRRNEDPWVDLLEAAFGEREGRILTVEVWKILNRPEGQRTQEDNRRVGEAMRELGWERVRTSSRMSGGAMRWFYARGSKEDLYVIRDVVTGEVNVFSKTEAEAHMTAAQPTFDEIPS